MKTIPAKRIKIALKAGRSLITENKTKELKEQYEISKTVRHVNYSTGHCNTNKVKDISQ